MLEITTDKTCISIAGDWHGSLHQAVTVLEHAYQQNCDIILQAGDFGIWKGDEHFLNSLQEHLIRYDQRLYFVDGNHECFPRLYSYPIDPITGLRPIRDNIFHLPRGFRFTINQVRFLALGGAYSVDRQWRTLNKTYWREEEVTDYDISQALLADDRTTDVLLMHDSPHPAPNLITDNPLRQAQGQRAYGYKAIQEARRHRHFLTPVFIAAQPKVLFHGHYHEFWVGQYTHSSGRVTKVVALNEGSAPMIEHAIILNLSQIKE